MGIFQKKLTVILMMACLWGGLNLAKPAPVKAIEKFTVQLSNPRPGADPVYKFYFTLNQKLKAGDWIQFIFPPGTIFEINQTTPQKKACFESTFGPDYRLLEDGSVLWQIPLGNDVDPKGSELCFTIPRLMGFYNQEGMYRILRIYNPPKAGPVRFKMATKTEPDWITSEPVMLSDCYLSAPLVDIEPKLAKEPAGYSIDFDILLPRDLKRSSDSISIQFPESVNFSKDLEKIQNDWITVNEVKLEVKPYQYNNRLVIRLPVDLKARSSVSIKIDSRVGIINPKTAGRYNLFLQIPPYFTDTPSFPYSIDTVADPALLTVDPVNAMLTAELNLLLSGERRDLCPLDKIYIRFPDAILVPNVISPTAIRINNKPVFAVSVKKQEVIITLKSYAKGWMPLLVTFYQEAGIKNPIAAEGPLVLEVKIEKDAQYMPTNPVAIH